MNNINMDERTLMVRQSNQLIEASYKIPSVGEGRLIRMLIAQISPNDEDFKTYRISVSDFAKFFGLSGGSAYTLIKKAADELAGRRIMLERGKSWLRLNWLSSAEYKEGSGYVELRFDAKLKPYLLQLQTHWKHYALENIINFRSSYSIRIFELLKVEEFKANSKESFHRSFEYDELRRILGIDEKEYPLFADVRRFVIESSVKEINENPDIFVKKVDYPKTGRKVSHIVFHCEKRKQTQLNMNEGMPVFEEVLEEKKHPEYIAELIAIGIDEATAYKWKRKYSVARLREAIAYTKAMQKAGKIRDSLTGFLVRAVADNIGATWVAEQEKKKQEQVKNESVEREKIKKEEQEVQNQIDKREAIKKRFHALTKKKKEALRTEYEKTASTFPLRAWMKAKEKTPESPENELTVSANFFNFVAQRLED